MGRRSDAPGFAWPNVPFLLTALATARIPFPSPRPRRYNPPMGTFLAFFGVSFVAFCVWLTIRIVNRRERWAKRTAWGVSSLLLLYPLSLGPACRIAATPMDFGFIFPAAPAWMSPYWPLGWLATDGAPARIRGGQRPVFMRLIKSYVKLWLPRGTGVLIPATRDGNEAFLVFGDG